MMGLGSMLQGRWERQAECAAQAAGSTGSSDGAAVLDAISSDLVALSTVCENAKTAHLGMVHAAALLEATGGSMPSTCYQLYPADWWHTDIFRLLVVVPVIALGACAQLQAACYGKSPEAVLSEYVEVGVQLSQRGLDSLPPGQLANAETLRYSTFYQRLCSLDWARQGLAMVAGPSPTGWMFYRVSLLRIWGHPPNFHPTAKTPCSTTSVPHNCRGSPLQPWHQTPSRTCTAGSEPLVPGLISSAT